MNMPEERERVYDVLTKINNTDSITFEKFQEIIKTAEAADVTSMWDSSPILLSAPNYCNFQGAPDSHIFRGDGEREEDRALAAAYFHPDHYNCPVCSLLCQLKHERISSREIPPIWHVRNHQQIYIICIICKVTFGLIWNSWFSPSTDLHYLQSDIWSHLKKVGSAQNCLMTYHLKGLHSSNVVELPHIQPSACWRRPLDLQPCSTAWDRSWPWNGPWLCQCVAPLHIGGEEQLL